MTKIQTYRKTLSVDPFCLSQQVEFNLHNNTTSGIILYPVPVRDELIIGYVIFNLFSASLWIGVSAELIRSCSRSGSELKPCSGDLPSTTSRQLSHDSLPGYSYWRIRGSGTGADHSIFLCGFAL